MPPKRSWDSKKIFAQSPALFQPPEWVDPHARHSAHAVALHLAQGLKALETQLRDLVRPVALLMNTEDIFNLVGALSFQFRWENTSESVPR